MGHIGTIYHRAVRERPARQWWRGEGYGGLEGEQGPAGALHNQHAKREGGGGTSGTPPMGELQQSTVATIAPHIIITAVIHAMGLQPFILISAFAVHSWEVIGCIPGTSFNE